LQQIIYEQLVQYAISRCQLISQYEGLSYGHTGLAAGIGENLYWFGSSANVTAPASQAIISWFD
jgi:LAS superfamily LD-carboxypeptidase LdcB